MYNMIVLQERQQACNSLNDSYWCQCNHTYCKDWKCGHKLCMDNSSPELFDLRTNRI